MSSSNTLNHGQMKRLAVETAYNMIDESQYGEITGEALADEMGIKHEDAVLYHALFAAKDEGLIRCDFGGGMRLPYRIRR